MGLTSAMYTGLSGLNANQSRIDTIGNNIANVNTTAFRASRSLFQTQVYNTLTRGTAPSASSGGVNPIQYGLGVTVGATQRINTAGSIGTTGIGSDAAIEGDGHYVIRNAGGKQMYTRDGSFSLNSENKLVTADGNYVQGFGIDDNFTIIPGTLTDLTIPLGTQTIARATQNVFMDGDLSSAGTISTTGSRTLSQQMVDGGGGPATAGTALTDLRDGTNPAVPLFANGSIITISGATKGGREMPTETFVVGTTGSTYGDFAQWMEDRFGIQSSSGLAGSPGVTINSGSLLIQSNAGEPNEIVITANNIRSDDAGAPLPFTFTQTGSADGSGVYTSLTVYDTLGSPVQVGVTFVLDSTPSSGPVWRYFIDSPDSSGASTALGTGLASFDNNGKLVGMTDSQFTLDRSNTGAATPIVFDLDLSKLNGLSTQTSRLVLDNQDGFPPGTLQSYSISTDGVIYGTFSTGLSRPLGQMALAMLPNAGGLVAGSNNVYELGPNAGVPRIVAPGSFGSGNILAGALEESNVDLSNEFIGLITASTGFQAASRVISVSNQMLDNLLLVLR